MITFHYPLLCHREYQPKQTKLFWCLGSISAGWMFAGMLLRILWMSGNVHFYFIGEVHPHRAPLPIQNLLSQGGLKAWTLKERKSRVAYWLWRVGSVIASAHKAVNQKRWLLLLIQAEDCCAAVVEVRKETWLTQHTHAHANTPLLCLQNNAIKGAESGLRGAAASGERSTWVNQVESASAEGRVTVSAYAWWTCRSMVAKWTMKAYATLVRKPQKQ